MIYILNSSVNLHIEKRRKKIIILKKDDEKINTYVDEKRRDWRSTFCKNT